MSNDQKNGNFAIPDVQELIGNGLQSIPAPISVPAIETLRPLLRELVEQDPGKGGDVAKAEALYVVHIEQGVQDHQTLRENSKEELSGVAKSRIHQLKDAIANLTSVSELQYKLTERVKSLRQSVRQNAGKAGLILSEETPGEIQAAIQRATGITLNADTPEATAPEPEPKPAIVEPEEPKAPGRWAWLAGPLAKLLPLCVNLLAIPPTIILGLTLGTMADMIGYLDIVDGIQVNAKTGGLFVISFGLIYAIGIIYEHIAPMIVRNTMPASARQLKTPLLILWIWIILAVGSAGVEVFVEGTGMHELAIQKHEARLRTHRSDKKNNLPDAPGALKYFIIGTIVSLPFFGVKSLRSWTKATKEQMALKEEEDEREARLKAESDAENARSKAEVARLNAEAEEAVRQKKFTNWLHNSEPAQTALVAAAELEDVLRDQKENKAEYDRLFELVRSLKEPLALSEETLGKFSAIVEKVDAAKIEFARLTGISLEAPEPNGHKPTDLAKEIEEKFPDGLFARRDGHPDNSPLS